MRATLRDVRHHPSWFADWWLELPLRRRDFWGQLLFEDGQGWLRWAKDERYNDYYIDEGLYAPESYVVAPPLRRFVWGWRYLFTQLRCVLFNFENLRQDMWPMEWPWAYSPSYRDKDRKKELWR